MTSQRDALLDHGADDPRLVARRRRLCVDGRRARHRRRRTLQRRRHDRLQGDAAAPGPGGRGQRRAAAAGARGAAPRRAAAARLGHGAAELRVHGQVEDEVEGEVGRLHGVGDDDGCLEQLPFGRFGGIEVEIDEFRGCDEG